VYLRVLKVVHCIGTEFMFFILPGLIWANAGTSRSFFTNQVKNSPNFYPVGKKEQLGIYLG